MAELRIELHEFDRLGRRLLAASRADKRELLDAIGQQQEDSARRRIRETKRAPDGRRWDPWSKRYARTRKPRHSLLVGEGELADSMMHEVAGDAAVDVFNAREYAAAQLFGNRGIPAREYLETSGEIRDPRDRDEISDIVTDYITEMLS